MAQFVYRSLSALKNTVSLQRMTRQRMALIEVLRRRNWHPTAEEVHGLVKEKAPSISLGTVYRNLDILARGGFIQAIDGLGPHRHYDGNPVPHLHFQCKTCGEMYDMESQEAWEPPALKAYAGFRVTGFRCLFEGYCPRCVPVSDGNTDGE